ncbi:hypothetical protein OA492_01950 [Pelagibacteraceae bacterium]|nr:hypothetical protein [Pelagibacteraceae bacterium]
MSRFLNILITSFFIYSVLNTILADTGPASKYEITITKVELCTGYPDSNDNDVTCTGSVTVGEGSLTVDIASVSPSAEIATFSDTSGLPIGKTFSHIKITLDKKYTITGYAQDDTDCWCRTESDSTFHSSYGKYGSHRAGICEVDEATAMSNAEEQTMHVTYRGTVVQCLTPACTSDSITTTVNHSVEQDGVDMNLYGLAFDAGTTSSTKSVSVIYKLSSPYTVGIVIPKIALSFGLSTAINSYEWDEDNDKCLIFPYYPRVDIAITD